MKTTVSIFRILAFKDEMLENLRSYPDWAIQMIELGCDSKYLNMLAASGSESSDYFSIRELLDRALLDLNFRIPHGETAVAFRLVGVVEDCLKKHMNLRETMMCFYALEREFCFKFGCDALADLAHDNCNIDFPNDKYDSHNEIGEKFKVLSPLFVGWGRKNLLPLACPSNLIQLL